MERGHCTCRLGPALLVGRCVALAGAISAKSLQRDTLLCAMLPAALVLICCFMGLGQIFQIDANKGGCNACDWGVQRQFSMGFCATKLTEQSLNRMKQLAQNTKKQVWYLAALVPENRYQNGILSRAAARYAVLVFPHYSSLGKIGASRNRV